MDMENIYENSVYKKDELDDQVYMNAQQQQQQQQQVPPTEEHTASPSFDWKIIISALGLLVVLGALTSLCVLGILYHNKVISTQILKEEYENLTDVVTLQIKKKDTKYQELVSACNETERLYEGLRVKNQQDQDYLSACSDKERQNKEMKMKYQRVRERISTCSVNQNCKLCEDGWRSLDLSCYYFSTNKLTWTQSKDVCVEKGGHLVIITSRTEQDFVSSQIHQTHWIGLNDLDIEGRWMWVNNEPLMKTSETFWFSKEHNEPDNWRKEDSSGENCGALGNEIGFTDKWFDASCRKNKRYICEKEPYLFTFILN